MSRKAKIMAGLRKRSTVPVLVLVGLTGSIPLNAQIFPVASASGAGANEMDLSGRRAVLSDSHALAALEKLDSNPSAAAIIGAADKALNAEPASVMDKTGIAPSGDKHDYYSIAPYLWPDQKNPDGPLVFRDGVVNPDYYSSTYDLTKWTSLCHRVECLAQAWALTRDARYSQQAVRFLRVWFIAPETRMNPSLDHAQLIRGKPASGGVIDTRGLPRLVDSLCLLDDSPHFSAADKQGLRLWMDQLLTWMTTKPLGIQEGERKNNRGTYYDAQVAATALYVGKTEVAKQALERAIHRLRGQIAADGSQPAELWRTKSLHYSVTNLQAYIICARLAERAGLNLWAEPSLHRAVAHLAPYSDPSKVWPHPEIDVDKARLQLASLLAFTSNAWKNPDVMLLAKRAGWEKDDAILRMALFQY